ncbi:serpin family protein [Bacillus kwashiorkori]|uniref:serpin family protein n=1 Tax=Bacillus kwashiorkori TaxID=1522318 RepID=UPI00078042A6|nr:serpin family protein [Bacillus kwashiorkori]
MWKKIASIALILILAACSTSGKANFSKDDYKMVTDASNQFAFDLLDELRLLKEENTLFSPISVHLALAMTYNGAATETKEQMASVLHIDQLQLEEVNRAYASFLNKVSNKKAKVKLSIGNSIWLKEGYPFVDDFINDTKNYYDATVREVDMQNPKTADEINKWVRESTKKKIDKIIDDSIDPNTVAYLINAIYFNGHWQKPFDKKRTYEDEFFINGTENVRHPFMFQEGSYRYFESDLFQAIDLPYSGNEMSMIILLPKEGQHLTDLYENMSFENWNNWKTQLHEMEGTIKLPKFKMEYDVQLNEPLMNLGMEIAFSGGADFSKMVENGGVFIDEVKHKSFIDVNEKGTEAAAVTSVAVKETAAMDSFQMIVNRPFFFAIQDNDSGLILFMGEVNNPAAK